MKTIPNYYSRSRDEILDLLPIKTSRALEIGCGEGQFRKHFNNSVEYWGIEPVESVAGIASGIINKVLTGTFDEVKEELPIAYFDTIICNDVIEHMVDHEKFFTEIKEYLTPDGCLVLSIPNVRYFETIYEYIVKKDWRYRESGILDSTHLRFFTKKSIERSLKNTQYQILNFKFLNIAKPKSILNRIILFVIGLILGNDTKYLQFGIQIKIVK